MWALWHAALSCWKQTSGDKKMDMVSNNPQVGQVIEMLPSCYQVWQENIPTPLYYHQPELMIQPRLDSYFYVVYTKFWSNNLNVAKETDTQTTFAGQFWWTCASLRFLLLARVALCFFLLL